MVMYFVEFSMNRLIKFISFFLILLSFIVYKIVNYEINLVNICKHDSRPVIFGEELCSDIYSNKISLPEDLIERLTYFISTKSVIRAKYENKNVVLKTPACDDEFLSIEEDFNNKYPDKILHSKNAIDIIKLHIQTSIRIPPGTKFNPKMRLCPQNSNTENLFNKINSSNLLVNDYLHLWTTVKTYPEPFILKILKPPEWPVPHYFGSCGRVIVVEDCGTMLTNFYLSPWSMRADLSYQLIEGALKFTFDDPDFAYYLTDISPDNIAVNENGKVRFIDLENIILVDKNPLISDDMRVYWERTHKSRHFDCVDCIVIEADSICEKQNSDHNIYAVCKEIFGDSSLMPDGFLHSAPSEIPELSQLNDMINNCIDPPYYSNRFEMVTKIMALLMKYK